MLPFFGLAPRFLRGSPARLLRGLKARNPVALLVRMMAEARGAKFEGLPCDAADRDRVPASCPETMPELRRIIVACHMATRRREEVFFLFVCCMGCRRTK